MQNLALADYKNIAGLLNVGGSRYLFEPYAGQHWPRQKMIAIVFPGKISVLFHHVSMTKSNRLKLQAAMQSNFMK